MTASAPVFARISYDLREAAEATGISERRLREAYNAADLEGHYNGSRLLFLAHDLHAYVASLPTERPGGQA